MNINETINGGFAEREKTAGDALPVEPVIEIRLTSLGRKTFTERYRDEGKGIRRSDRDLRSKAA